MLRPALVLAVLLVGVAPQHPTVDPADLTPSLCSTLIPKLKPVKNIKMAELAGHWITVNKATFGTEGIANFGRSEDPNADFSVNLDDPGASLQAVRDCIDQVVANVSEEAVVVKSRFFFEDPRDNVEVLKHYKVAKDQKGVWRVQVPGSHPQETEDVLILAVDSKSMVLATCHNGLGAAARSAEGGLRTEVLTVARHNAELKPKKQLELIGMVAKALGERRLVAAQLSTACKKSADSGAATATSAVTAVAVLAAVVLL